MNDSIVAIITARGGSKRIPRKNIRTFCGKPIISYSIEAALESHLFDEVMVSTDDEEIAGIARRYGAVVPFLRSEKTSNDYATTIDVVKEVLEKYSDMGREFRYGCCIYPTAPFMTSERLVECFRSLKTKNADSCIPIVRFSYPPQRAFIEKNGFISFKSPEYKNSRSQDLELMFHDAGQFYFFRIDSFATNNGFLSGNVAYIELPEIEVQDIDNEMDWRLAELKYSLLKEQ